MKYDKSEKQIAKCRAKRWRERENRQQVNDIDDSRQIQTNRVQKDTLVNSRKRKLRTDGKRKTEQKNR